LVELLDPAAINTDPPLPTAEAPTLREILPDDPPLETPVDTTTDPEAPLVLPPLPRFNDPEDPRPCPLTTFTGPLDPEGEDPLPTDT